MNRREFLHRSASAVTVLAARRLNGQATEPKRMRITVDPERRTHTIPADFLGLGYEISAIAKPGLLSAQNRSYVRLVRALGARGVIRVGGNTSDYSAFSANANAMSEPTATVVNESNLKELGTFLHATGWSLIWGLNLGQGSEREAIEEAQAVMAATQASLASDQAGVAFDKEKRLVFEIGNEPDLFGRRAGHRQSGYDYQEYLKEYRRYKAAIRAKLPRAVFAGPDVASATDWVTRFAADEGNDLKLLTHHYYRECQNPGSTFDKLLHPDPKLAPMLDKLNQAATSSGVPYRICETNSFCGGGKPGVSDTFGAALWVLDYLFVLASGGASGVNIETDVNQLGFISSYSPIAPDEQGGAVAKPSFYGMLAFAKANFGSLAAVNYDPGSVNLTAYASVGQDRRVAVVAINKDVSQDATVTIDVKADIRIASLSRLSGPSLESKEGTQFGALGPVKPKGKECEVHVPAASAAIVYLGI